ncbi:Galactose/lactose metabolism regulatory protein GAL80 [Cyphellophora attinorum]|uniref:Galactose/lactose metabolism regulatory protein GAL80 n=1 Tax=Cyphellophora attinorum TaxID=1664694 RepID=A0A0N1NZI5_9EURO|nr:Galactose/lactose metabolism regulatory protein GAL80 [Phialophora attinorum]KPI40640.1 Galactose/lactose metabolism regulatory protein GAL80 [Phialophora attinorum]
MAPIRVGIVGLSAQPATWGQLAHHPFLSKSPHYKIVALCNSSIASGQAAIKFYGLDPETTKAYDNYAALATDPDIDFLIITTRADTHYDAVLPALKSPPKSLKGVYCEWPLAATTEQAKEMHDLAKKAGLKTVVGLQGRLSPTVTALRRLIQSGRFGQIHSINYHGAINVWQNNAAGAKYYYFMDKAVGGNLLTIYGGHCLDSLLYALDAELVPGGYKPMLANLRPRMWRTGADGQVLKDEGTYEKNTPDQILLQGRVKLGDVDDGDTEGPSSDPVLSFHLRAGNRFSPTSPGSTWRIYGTKGEVVVEFASAGPQIGAPTSMKFSNMKTGEVEDLLPEAVEGGRLDGSPDVAWTDLPTPGQNIGRIFEAYALAKQDNYANWGEAVKRHELLDEFWASGM